MTKQSVSAGGVVLNPKGEVLVVNQRGKSWSLPKGHVDAGEDLMAAARREIHEESGIRELTHIRPLGSYVRESLNRVGSRAGELKTLHFFLFTTTQMQLQPIDPHNPEARWVSPDKVTDLLTHPKDKEFFRSIRNDLHLT